MPTISMFYGIIIRMYYAPKEHHPPHIHAYYQDYKVSVQIENGNTLDGILPIKQMKYILAWIEIHKEELLADWQLCQNGERPFTIEPLKWIRMYQSVLSVEATDNYEIILEFSNKEKKIFDMKPFLDKGIFKELQELSVFKTVKVKFDTVEWDNEVDFDPEVLYNNSIPYIK